MTRKKRHAPPPKPPSKTSMCPECRLFTFENGKCDNYVCKLYKGWRAR